MSNLTSFPPHFPPHDSSLRKDIAIAVHLRNFRNGVFKDKIAYKTPAVHSLQIMVDSSVFTPGTFSRPQAAKQSHR